MRKPQSESRRAVLKGALLVGPLLVFTRAPAARAADLRGTTSKAVVADTAYGKVRGFIAEDGVRTFRGIPYAAPPTGANRFKPPRRPAPWVGVRDATQWGNKCPQVGSSSTPETALYLGNATQTPGEQNEDCLVVNIWTRGKRDGGKRPVMLRIHGGGFAMNSGNNQKYWGHNTVRRGDVVYVSVNHRLGALGFLDLSQLGGEQYALSGNAGMLDLVACLEWIRDNIEEFGGDPNNVMIWGESGGGCKVSVLMAMPAAKGLFHRAVIESGPWLKVKAPEQARELAERFLSRLGMDKSRLDQLHQLPTYRLLEAQLLTTSRRWFPQDPPIRNGFSPVLDPAIPAHPFEPGAPQLSADVPMIIGYNLDEGTLLLQSDPDLYALDEAGLVKRVQEKVGQDAQEVIQLYRATYPSATRTDLISYISRDLFFVVGSVAMAERKAALAAAPAYMYRFDWKSPAFNGMYGATHGLEDAFFMDNVAHQEVLTRNSPEAFTLAAKINSLFIAFARTGEPRAAELPEWPKYDDRSRATMIFDNRSSIEKDPGAAVRRYWSEHRPPLSGG
jgi:para-nitrobenzyl esterase